MVKKGEKQRQLEQMVRDLAGGLDHLLNPDQENKTIGFGLILFEHNNEFTTWSSNCSRSEMIKALKEMITRFEHGYQLENIEQFTKIEGVISSAYDPAQLGMKKS